MKDKSCIYIYYHLANNNDNNCSMQRNFCLIVKQLVVAVYDHDFIEGSSLEFKEVQTS